MDFSVRSQDRADADADRARIDNGFGFALAAFFSGIGALALLQRIGLPEEVLRGGVIALVFSGLAVVAVMLRTMRPLEFYAGGRKLPGTYAGLAFAGLVLGLFIPFFPPMPAGIGFGSVVAGFGIGCLWALFVTGPIVRRSGAFSVADFVVTRFPHILVRAPIVFLMGVCAACVALGGYDVALDGFAAATGLDRLVGAILLGSLLVVLIVPAGLAGVVWVIAAATVVTVTALVLPLALDLVSGVPLVLPIIGNQTLWADATVHFATLTGAHAQAGFSPALVFGIGLGLASLAPLFGAPIATRNEGESWRCGLVGMLWLAFGAVLMAATIAASVLTIEADASGRAPNDLPPSILAASGHGDIGICGFFASEPAALTSACAAVQGSGGPLRMRDIEADGVTLLEGLPMLRGSEPTLARLAAVFIVILGIGTAAAAIQFIVTALSHDLVHPRRRRFSPVSRRLALARLATIGFVALAGFWLASQSIDARAMFAIALTLSAALVAPLLGLALMPRATSTAAFAALCVAGFVTARFLLFQGVSPPSQWATDALFAAFDGLAVGLFVSFLPKFTAKR